MLLIPIERENPVRETPWSVYILIVVNGLISVLLWVPEVRADVVTRLGFVPANPHLTTLFTSMFLHAGFWHVAANMFFLWMFGDNVEDILGPALFFIVYAVCGAAGGLVHWAMNTGSTLPTIGASGAVSGIIGLYMVFFPKARANLFLLLPFWYVQTRAYVAILAWFALQVAGALVGEVPAAKPYVHIAFWDHVGGFVTGVALGFACLAAGFRERYLHRYAHYWTTLGRPEGPALSGGRPLHPMTRGGPPRRDV